MQASTSPSCGGADGAAGDGSFERAALHARKRLADVIAERGIERERAIVEGGLHQPDSRGAAFVRAIHYSLHELAADSEILHRGIDGDGADAANGGPLVEAIAADEAASALCHHAIEVGVGEHHAEHVGGYFDAGKIAGETVGGVDGGEGAVADLPAGGGVFGCSGPNYYFRLSLRWTFV